MASVLELPRFGERISDDEWCSRDTGNAATHAEAFGNWPSAPRRIVFPFLDGRLIIEDCDPLPPWLSSAIRSLDELGGLPANWDSYGAGKIRHSNIVTTVHLLLAVMRDDTPLPSFVPTNQGTILLEWHMRGIDLEVEIRGRGRLHVVFEDFQDGTEWESELSSDLSKLVNCIERLTAKG
jgi:hypothetical protein